MAVQYVKGGSGLLDYFANNAQIVGMATGQPWLTALGAGVNAYNSGGSYTTPGWVNKNTMDEIGGLFKGNIASKKPDMKTQGGK